MTYSFTRMATQGWLTTLSALLLFVGCGSDKTQSDSDRGVLLRAGDEVLTLTDVVRKMPVGMEASDSVAMFQLIVDNWVKSKVLSGLAGRKLPDLNKIESKVEDYRNRLIVAEYLNEMKKGKDFKISPDSIREFYDRYKGDMLLESPLVKGVYLKVSADRADIEEIKSLVFCGSDECIDKLEKNVSGDAIQYDYFKNDWIDWQIIADQIPYRFYDPDAFLKSSNNFETAYDGSVYILHISEYIPTGSEPPYEFASTQIGELMERTNMRKFEESLVRSLINKALNDGELVAVGYDPVGRKVLESNTVMPAIDTFGSSTDSM